MNVQELPLIDPDHCFICETVIEEAILIAVQFGGIEGEHHINWVIDQMVRILSGKNYDEIVKNACDGDEGPNTYKWDIGIAP